MPVIQTFALGGESKRYLSLARLSTFDKEKLKEAMEKQLVLVSRALIRGDNLAQLGDDMTAANLDKARQANINAGVRPKNRPPNDAPKSAFEKMFSSMDVSELILRYISLIDQKTIAAVSRTCRETIGSYRRTWDLGQMLFGLCDVALETDGKPQKLALHLGNAVWVHGRGTWNTDRHRQPLPMGLYSPFFMDDLFFEHPTATRDLVASTLATYYQGKPLERNIKFETASARCKTRVETTLRMAIEHFRGLPEKTKSNVYYCKLDRIQPMLVSFAQHGEHLHHVHFDNVPFLDVRILAVALENLPRLNTLVVEACELMHLGKLTTILDLLYWIGVRRDHKFITFDFFPKAWFGSTERRMATSVLTFNPPADNEHPRIVMAAIITAAMKAWSMELDIVKSGSLLEKFLLLVPMEFGLMALFLRHLREYAVMCRSTPPGRRTIPQQQTMNHHIRQILSAINRPVYNMRFDGMREMDFDVGKMHEVRRECRDCKNKVYRLLIKPSQWHGSSNLEYTCSACLLTPLIEADDHAWLDDKRKILSALLGEKEWNDETPQDALERSIDDDDFEIPSPLDQVCPTISNNFVQSSRPKMGGEAEWLRKREKNFWYGKYASSRLRNLHKDDAAWEYARIKALWLDSKNRFASEGLGMSLDDPEKARQPYRQHSLADRTWEGTYEQNLVCQGQERILDEADNKNWRSVRDIMH